MQTSSASTSRGKIRFWYKKPHFWQFRKKRYYRNILVTEPAPPKQEVEK